MSRDDYEYDDDGDDQNHRIDAARGVYRHHRQIQPMSLSTPFIQKIVAAVAAATVIGGGTVVLADHGKISVLEYAVAQQQIIAQHMDEKLDKLLDRTGGK